MELKDRARVFKALGHPEPLAITDKLADGERCGCELLALPALSKLTGPTVSQHLLVLKNLRHHRRRKARQEDLPKAPDALRLPDFPLRRRTTPARHPIIQLKLMKAIQVYDPVMCCSTGIKQHATRTA